MGDRTVTAVDGAHQDSASPVPAGRGGPPAPGPRGAHDACGARPRHPVRAVVEDMRRPRRPRLWFEILLILASYWIYSLIRSAVPDQRALAARNAAWLWDLEQQLGIAVEGAVNRAINAETWLIVGMNYYYATLHFAVTICVLIWLYRRHPGRYSASRLVLLVATASALIGYYVFPLAPPRLTSHDSFVDTLIVHRTWGSLASDGLQDVSNQYAAMPSMHVGWALWCAVTVFALSRALWARILAVLYPAATLVVIVATANHFWLDAVGGIICLVVGYAVARWWYGVWPYALPQRVPVPRPPAAGALPRAVRGPLGASPAAWPERPRTGRRRRPARPSRGRDSPAPGRAPARDAGGGHRPALARGHPSARGRRGPTDPKGPHRP